jgi:hypothetical protein
VSPRVFDRFMVDVELGSNPKIGRLNDREFRCLVCGVWALAAKANPRGYLVVAGQAATERDVAYQGRCSVSLARTTLGRLRQLGMVEMDERVGFEVCHDWDALNPGPRPDPTNADRQRRFRNRHNGARNGESNVTDNGGVTESNAGEVKEKERPASQAQQVARKRATRRVDQSQPPPDFPDELLPRLNLVLTICHGAWDARGGIEPMPRGVGMAMLRNVRADHERVARRLEHWLLAGNGRRAQCKDIAQRLGDWIADEPAADQGSSNVVSMRDPALERRDRFKLYREDSA